MNANAPLVGKLHGDDLLRPVADLAKWGVSAKGIPSGRLPDLSLDQEEILGFFIQESLWAIFGGAVDGDLANSQYICIAPLKYCEIYRHS